MNLKILCGFIKTSRAKQYYFSVINTALPSRTPICFIQNLLEKMYSKLRQLIKIL